jgi:hypothetical protein
MKMHFEHFHASLWREGHVGWVESYETQHLDVNWSGMLLGFVRLNPTYTVS